MREKTKLWWKALAAATVSGLVNSGLAVLGIAGAQVAGVQVNQLQPKQFSAACISGAIVGCFMYLRQSPVPPDSTGDTNPPFIPTTGK